MQLIRWFGVTTCIAAVIGCGDHYEGGGRREEVPIDTNSSSGGPNIGLGGGMSSSGGGGTTAGGAGGTDAAGSAGTPGFPFTAGSGGSSGDGSL
jgi:hypothetical protein